MSGSRSRSHRSAIARASVVPALAVACVALTACQTPVPVLTGQHGPGGGPTTSSTALPTALPTAPPTVPPTSSPATPPPTGTDPDPNCTLIVPPAPLSAAGLATPYRFTATNPSAGACHEANPDQSAFVEAAILDPATGSLSIYHPLVIDDGTQPAIAPVRPALPPRAVVGVWFGYQANVLTLRKRHIRRGVMNLRYRAADSCVNGLPGSPFGQFAYCGAPQFFAAANAAIRAGKLAVPPLGTGSDGLPCPTTRDFGVVDQDQSDNLPGSYLATPDGRTAQFSEANSKALPDATVLNNASDNGLVDNLLDPVLGCHPATAPDLSADRRPSSALALNELQAAADQAAPIALVPPNDPMTVAGNGATSIAKTNLYRVGVDQPPVNRATDTGAAYCNQMAKGGLARLARDQRFTAAAPSPDPGVAADLNGFLLARLNDSWGNLGCPALTHRATPADAVGAATAVATAVPTTAPTTAPTTPTPTATPNPAAADVADPTSSPTATTSPATGATATGATATAPKATP